MPVHPRSSNRRPYLLFLEDQGMRVTQPDGLLLGMIQDTPDRSAHRASWAEELQRLLPKGASVQVCIGLSRLGVQCQESPAMPPQEAQAVALRAAAADPSGESMLVGHALEADPEAQGGHVHWSAYLPTTDLAGWSAALEAAGLEWVHAAAWPRALLRGLPPSTRPARDRVILAMAPRQGRVLFFRGPSLMLQRSFQLAPDLSEAEGRDQAVEETSRTLQFFKQRYRGSTPGELLAIGTGVFPDAQVARLRAMGLAVQESQGTLDEVLVRGLAQERAPQGLDLRPGHVQEAHRRRTLRAVVVLAAVALLGAFILGGGLVHTRERMVEAEATRVEAELARRQAEDQGRLRVVAARFPLLRLRAAEQRQTQATEHLSRLAALLLSPPRGVALDKVDIQQQPGPELTLSFQVSGTALTGSSFSVGPLASYVASLQHLGGLALDPLQDIRVSDRLVAGESVSAVDPSQSQPQARAITRFTLSGRLL